jgi:hypothetical protein
MSDETRETSRVIKNELVKKQFGADLTDILKDQLRDTAVKAEFHKRLTEQRMQEARQTNAAQVLRPGADRG